MLLINKSVVFVTCSNFVWFIQVLIICFNVYPHIFSCRILNVFYPYNLWDINMYMHIRTCLADNFVHMFVSGFFHEKYNLDLFHFKSQDFYIIIFHRKKNGFVPFCRQLRQLFLICIWKNETKFIQLFVKAAVFSSNPSLMYNN